MNINEKELEQQRRESILNSDNYLQFEILIGKTKETINGRTGIIPCTTMNLNNVGPKEIGCLYQTLIAMTKTLEEEYPEACLIAKLTTKTSMLNMSDFSNE